METKNTPEFAKNHLLNNLVKELHKVLADIGTTEASQDLTQMFFELSEIHQEGFIPENRKTDFNNPQSYLLTIKSLSNLMYSLDSFKEDIKALHNEINSI